MNTNFKICCVLLIVLALSACAFSQPPKREVYTGKDQVGQINKDMIIGKWEMKILNPIEGENQEFRSVMHYMADGSITMDGKVDTGMGEIELEVIGTWLVEGDFIKQTATDVREKTNSSVNMLVKLFKGTMLKNANGTANVYEASADRLLIVSVEDGQAQELTRLK